jgi:hypothetical protein
MTPTTFFAATDLVVIGSNPEFADVSNPHGDLFGSTAYVVAEDAEGNRVRLVLKTSPWESEVLPAAERMAAALNARLANGKLPVGFDSWVPTRPAYGSDAYVDYGAADDIMFESELEGSYA